MFFYKGIHVKFALLIKMTLFRSVWQFCTQLEKNNLNLALTPLGRARPLIQYIKCNEQPILDPLSPLVWSTWPPLTCLWVGTNYSLTFCRQADDPDTHQPREPNRIEPQMLYWSNFTDVQQVQYILNTHCRYQGHISHTHTSGPTQQHITYNKHCTLQIHYYICKSSIVSHFG